MYEARVQRIIEDLTPAIDWLRARHRVPTGVRVEAIDACHIEAIEAVAALAVNLPCGPATALRRLVDADADGHFCPDRSVAMLLERRVVGAFLVQPCAEPDVAFIYGVVVCPVLRRTWAAAWLKHHAVERLRTRGIERVWFEADSVDTCRHARRVGARMVD